MGISNSTTNWSYAAHGDAEARELNAYMETARLILTEVVTEDDRERAQAFSIGERSTLTVWYVSTGGHVSDGNAIGWGDVPALRGDWEVADVLDLADIFGRVLALDILRNLRQLSGGQLVRLRAGGTGYWFARVGEAR